MPKKKRPSEKPETQFERFVETARKLDVDETGKQMADAFKALKPTKKQQSTTGQ